MGFRFRKRIKLFPGAWLNVSKSGISTSIGGKGLTVNLKDGKTKTTISAPGTGISYSETTAAGTPGRGVPLWAWLVLLVAGAVLLVLVR